MKKNHSESSGSTEKKLLSESFLRTLLLMTLPQLTKLMLIYKIFITLNVVNKVVNAFSKKTAALNRSVNLTSSDNVFYYYESTRICTEYYFHVPNGASNCHLDLLNRLPHEYVRQLVLHLVPLLNH